MHDLERIADEIYGQDIISGTCGVVFQLFSGEENSGLLGQILAFFKERFPEAISSGTFVAVERISEEADREPSQLFMTVMNNGICTRITAIQEGTTVENDIDPLTGVFTRTRIEQLFDECLDSVQTCRSAVIVADIDRLDQINVNVGHDAGDYVLSKVAEVLRDNVRETDSIGRWESEKFLILLRDIDTEGATLAAERLRHAVEVAEFNDVGQVTISEGVTIPDAGEVKTDVFNRADLALKDAKMNGRNRFVVSISY
jgi:diguanylate cyclase (GGDEF)-like protein